jgi:hypothetical protein
MLKIYIGNKNCSSWIDDALVEKRFVVVDEPWAER